MRLSVHVLIGALAMGGAAAQQVTPAPAPGAQTGAAATQQPVRPLSPSQQMPGAPKVDFSAGKLTVTANNSTVQDVVNAVHAATGTKFVVSGGPMQDRLFGKFGPASVPLVLRQILKGSNFSYILISDPRAPYQVQTAMLMPPSVATSQPVAVPQPNANVGQQQAQEVPAEQAQEDETPQPEPAQEVPQQQQQMQTQQGQPGQFQQQQFPVQIQPQNGVPSGADPTQPKTPEQLLQELQRLQQLRIQQQQQQPQQNPQE
ncbi:MAG: hypothetical protein NVS9B15_06100 [Acidobacteriaceae bacterium]